MSDITANRIAKEIDKLYLIPGVDWHDYDGSTLTFTCGPNAFYIFFGDYPYVAPLVYVNGEQVLICSDEHPWTVSTTIKKIVIAYENAVASGKSYLDLSNVLGMK